MRCAARAIGASEVAVSAAVSAWRGVCEVQPRHGRRRSRSRSQRRRRPPQNRGPISLPARLLRGAAASRSEVGSSWHFGGLRTWLWRHNGIQVNGWIQLGARGVLHHGFSCRNAEGEARWRPIVVDLTEESGQATMESLPEHNSHRCTRDSPTSRGCLRERGSRGGGEQAAAQGIATMLPQGQRSERGRQAAQPAAGSTGSSRRRQQAHRGGSDRGGRPLRIATALPGAEPHWYIPSRTAMTMVSSSSIEFGSQCVPQRHNDNIPCLYAMSVPQRQTFFISCANKTNSTIRQMLPSI